MSSSPVDPTSPEAPPLGDGPLSDGPLSDRPLRELDIIGLDTYARDGYPHAAWTRLRREAPVWWCERDDCDPFWAVTRHADILKASRQPAILQNGPRLAVFPELELNFGDGDGGGGGEEEFAHHLLNMDPPEHAAYRKVSSQRFTPRAIRRLAPSVERITSDLLDELAGDGGVAETNFVETVSAPLTLSVLAEMLGVPQSDWRLMFRWTNEIIGSTDPEYQTAGTAEDTSDNARLQLFSYFMEMVRERRVRPTEDIVSTLANAKIDGKHLPDFELLSYCFLLVVAGNETTRNAMSGGLVAMIENPEQLRKLQSDPSLVNSAVEEIVRWTSPVIQFCRTPSVDFELRGQRIQAGQSMCLFYPSANRDEDVFDDPFEFRVDRQLNPHLGFGIGEHFCLGANLARLELRVAFAQIAKRFVSLELTGAPERLRSSFVGGVKRVPIRYQMTTG